MMGFPIPASLDLPSEMKAKMKAIVIDALQLRRCHSDGMTDEEKMLLAAMLTES